MYMYIYVYVYICIYKCIYICIYLARSLFNWFSTWGGVVAAGPGGDQPEQRCPYPCPIYLNRRFGPRALTKHNPVKT